MVRGTELWSCIHAPLVFPIVWMFVTLAPAVGRPGVPVYSPFDAHVVEPLALLLLNA